MLVFIDLLESATCLPYAVLPTRTGSLFVVTLQVNVNPHCTGFSADAQKKATLNLSAIPKDMRPMLAECSAIYQLLLPMALRPLSVEKKV